MTRTVVRDTILRRRRSRLPWIYLVYHRRAGSGRELLNQSLASGSAPDVGGTPSAAQYGSVTRLNGESTAVPPAFVVESERAPSG
jgi:hypothetical protein